MFSTDFFSLYYIINIIYVEHSLYESALYLLFTLSKLLRYDICTYMFFFCFKINEIYCFCFCFHKIIFNIIKKRSKIKRRRRRMQSSKKVFFIDFWHAKKIFSFSFNFLRLFTYD